MTMASELPHDANPQDSSDDDIDEDELDMLAALVAEESENEQPATEQPSEPSEPLDTSRKSNTASDNNSQESAKSDQVSSKSVNNGEEVTAPQKSFMSPHPSSLHKKASSTPIHAPPPRVVSPPKGPPSAHRRTNLLSSPSQTPAGEQEETEVEKQLRLMKEQIRLLEAQVKSQKKEEPLKSPTRKARLLEEDIFSPKSEPSTGKAKPEASTSKQQGRSTEKKKQFHKNFQRKQAEEALFGSDSNSDWSDLEGEKTCEYDQAGQNLNKLLKKKRQAHRPREDPTPTPTPAASKSQSPAAATSKPQPPTKRAIEPAREAPPWIKTTAESKSVVNGEVQEPFSGIRIVKPLLSYDQLRYRMESRRHIPLSNLHLKVNTGVLDSDWVTVAVVVAKSDPKVSSKGKQYSVWTLSDLTDCDKIVSFYLFGQTHQALWKTVTGSVVGILNAQIMSNSEKYQQKSDQISIMCLDPKQVMLMGASKDLGTCKATNKNGRPCTNFINLSKEECCKYHVQKMYKQVCAKRSELQSGFTGVTPRSFEQKIFGKGKGHTTVNYGGQTFTSMPETSSKRKGGRGVSVASLQHHALKPGLKGKVTTVQLHSLLPQDANTLAELQNSTAAAKTSKNDKAFHDLLTAPTPGAMNLVKHIMKKENADVITEAKAKNVQIQSVTARDLLKQHEAEMKEKREAAKRRASQPEPALPKLGRGFGPGGNVDLDVPLDIKAAKAKAAAVWKLKQKEGAAPQKLDPNAVKRSPSHHKQERVRKRVEESSASATDSSSPSTSEPRKKRSRLLGDLDLSDPKVQRILSANSKHAGELSKEEQERQEQYFSVLEKKEQMEEKMISTKSITVKAVSCKQCHYTYYAPSELCKSENHTLKYLDATKKFFECGDCKNRTSSLNRLPRENCTKCGGHKWLRTGMMKEKKVAQPGDALLLRGEERKFVNS